MKKPRLDGTKGRNVIYKLLYSSCLTCKRLKNVLNDCLAHHYRSNHLLITKLYAQKSCQSIVTIRVETGSYLQSVCGICNSNNILFSVGHFYSFCFVKLENLDCNGH